jgi:flagellar basal-body rod protein FlgB
LVKLIEGEAPMFEKLEIVAMAQGMAAHAGARHALIAQNVANADTPGYKARDLPDFASLMRDAPTEMRATRQGHLNPNDSKRFAPLSAGTPTDPNGNSVSLEAEMVKAAATRQQHDMALSVYRASSDIVRASLGRVR